MTIPSPGSTGTQPISGGSAGSTRPPSARLSAWPPKHSPSTGTPASTAPRIASISSAGHDGAGVVADSSEPSDAIHGRRTTSSGGGAWSDRCTS